jgi:hypothetical protein
MTARPRTVEPEILDELPPTDARAIRSRRDLQRINRVMGSSTILGSAIRHALASAPPDAAPRILELGGGDGTLALRIATRLATSWPVAELTLLDRQALISESTGTAFAHLGWSLRRLTVDALEWARAPTQQQRSCRWDVILANLFLHHFNDAGLRELLASAACRCNAFIACEPRRSSIALVGSRLLPALGVSADTRHDAVISVRAGFLGNELWRLWPADEARWRLAEGRAGIFSHLFVATRGDTAS